MQKRTILLSVRMILVVIIFVLAFGIYTRAEAATNFEGKVITFVVPYNAGGSTDIFTRFVAIHLSKFIPGKPRIVVRNIPGGETVIGSNYAWNSKPDGKTLLAQGGSTIGNNIMRPKGTVYKLHEMHPIFSLTDGVICYSKPSIISKPEDIITAKGIIFGQVSPAGGSGSIMVWSRELLGFKAKAIFGYSGGGAVRGAFLQGELNTVAEGTIAFNSSVMPYVEKGEVVPVFQAGMLDENGEIIREPAAPDIPTPVELYERVHGKKPSGLVFDTYKLMVGTRTFGRTLLLPKDVPADTVAIFEKAVAEMAKDPKFLKAKERINPNPAYLGKNLKRGYPKGVSAPPELIAFMKKILKEKYNIAFE